MTNSSRSASGPTGSPPCRTAPTRCSRPAAASRRNPSIVAVARLAPVKRFELLLDAAASARERVAGPDAHDRRRRAGGRTPARARSRELGGADWVTFAGWVPHRELIDLYRSAWIVASASLAEGWGLSLTEAAGCGTPAVATRHPGPPQQRRRRGHRRARRRRPSSATRSPRCCSTTALRLRLGQAALERARTLTWDASALGIIEVLHRAACG